MKAIPALAAGSFAEFPVAAPLRGSFACIWVHRLPEKGAPPIIVAPDGTIDLQWIDGAFRVAGPDKAPQIEIIPDGAAVIGFRFYPAAASGWLGISAAEIVGTRLKLDDLWGSKARRLASDVAEGEGIEELIFSIQSILVRNVRASTPADPVMRAAFDLVKKGPPADAPLVPWLGRVLAMSERTLRRRFNESFGYGPKTLDRILRHQRFMRLARNAKGISTATLAAEAGYSDQAHLVRESRRLTGSTPHELGRFVF